MQLKGGPAPVGVMFDTALSRIEHVLAMALLYKLQAMREARVASMSVSRPDLLTAAFCDAMVRFLNGGGRGGSPPIGISGGSAAGSAEAPTPNVMAEAVLNARTEAGDPRYPRGISKLNDTADVAALIRNGISAQQPGNGVIFIAGPLSNLAAAWALPDLAPLAQKRVRALVISASADDLKADLKAVRKILASWSTPIAFADLPDLAYPGAELEQRFAWSANHPVAEAYRTYKKMPYDAPLQTAAAALYAVHPESPFFSASAPGSIEILDDGQTRFTASDKGSHRMLRLADNQNDAATRALAELVSSQPPAPAAGRGRGPAKQE
jgi:hypothetical protein